jgi:RND family efflux transporter MFP subunit
MINEQTTEVKKKGKGKIILVLLLTLALATGAAIGFYFIWRGAGYLVTDNARVTTALIAIAPDIQGRLERFTAHEGSRVSENEIIGWVEGGEAMRSPVRGLVIHTNTVQGQAVSPMEPIAVIADLNRLHVVANIEETDITKIQVGQPAIVTIDPFGNRQFNGYISEIGHITSAELTGNAMFFNTGGTFTRVTHLIPVKINILDDIDLESLIGVNARVRIPLRSETAPRQTCSEPTNIISAKGTVESVQTRNVYTTLGSIIERVNVETGDIVRRGQILATLETAELNVQLQTAEAALKIAEIDLATAEHNYEILSGVYASGDLPRNNLQQSEFALQSAVAHRAQAQTMLDAARIPLERSILKSPINGAVTEVIAKEGEIGMGRMFAIADTENLKITTRFRDHDLARIKTGMEVTIIPDGAVNAKYTGIINRINPAAATLTPIVEFETEILVTSANTSLRIGMGVRVEVEE